MELKYRDGYVFYTYKCSKCRHKETGHEKFNPTREYINQMFDRIGYAMLNGTWKGLWSVPLICVFAWYISAFSMLETVPFLLAFVMAIMLCGAFIGIDLNRWRSDR